MFVVVRWPEASMILRHAEQCLIGSRGHWPLSGLAATAGKTTKSVLDAHKQAGEGEPTCCPTKTDVRSPSVGCSYRRHAASSKRWHATALQRGLNGSDDLFARIGANRLVEDRIDGDLDQTV